MRISDWSSDVCSSDLYAGDQLVESHLDGLGDLVGIAQNLREIAFDTADQLFLGELRIRPILARLEDDEHVGRVRRHRVGRQLGETGSASDGERVCQYV